MVHLHVLALGLGLAALTVTPVAATMAYSVALDNHQLSVVDLESGDVRPFLELSFPQPGQVVAVERGPENALFAVFQPATGSAELWQIALQDGALTRRGALGVAVGQSNEGLRADLAYDPVAGVLFLAASGQLFAIDPQSPTAAALGVAQELLTVALLGDTLYGILLLPTGSPLPDPALVTLDRESGASTFVAALSDPTLQEINAMSFDDQGVLWLLESFQVPIAPPQVQHTFYRLGDLSSGVLSVVSSYPSLENFFYASLALIPGSGDITAVPTLDSLGAGLLIAILSILALRALRRVGP